MKRLIVLLFAEGCITPVTAPPPQSTPDDDLVSSDGPRPSDSTTGPYSIGHSNHPDTDPPSASSTGELPHGGSSHGAPIDDEPQPQPEPSWPAFEDVSAIAGVDATHHVVLGHHAIGQAWGDYDNDGWLDLYVTGGADPSVLYHNEGDGTFSKPGWGTIVALELQSTAGAAWGDYNNDGWIDLYVTCDGANHLFENLAGSGFKDQSIKAGVAGNRYSVMSAWGDYDSDGWIDLYIANHGGDHDIFYRNNGDGTFANVGGPLGIQAVNRPAFAATFIDYDQDGDLDIHVVNDHIKGNDLYRNDGPGCLGWCFTNVRELSGTDIEINGMGQAVGDYDNDGDLDLFFSDIFYTHLLKSLTAQGRPTFQPTDVHGLQFDAISWGTVFIDYDNDGWLDLYLATQNSDREHSNRLFRNRADGTFEDVSIHSGADDTGFSYGVGYADYDNDGFIDLVVGNRGQGYTLYRNTTTTGPGHHWVTLLLKGGGPINRDAIGARVTLLDTMGISHMAEVRSGSTMGGGNSMRLHFGLGEAEVDLVQVRWPNGVEETIEGLPTDELTHLNYP